MLISNSKKKGFVKSQIWSKMTISLFLAYVALLGGTISKSQHVLLINPYGAAL